MTVSVLTAWFWVYLSYQTKKQQSDNISYDGDVYVPKICCSPLHRKYSETFKYHKFEVGSIGQGIGLAENVRHRILKQKMSSMSSATTIEN